MPYSLVLHCLSPRNAISPEDLQGQKALALFLEELIQKQDTALATRLHAPRQSKPFTTAIVHPLGSYSAIPKRTSASGRRTGSNSAPNHEVKIRLTLLDDALYPLISRFFLQHPDSVPFLRLGKTPLTVSAVSTTPASGEPWAGMARFDDLLSQASPHDSAWSLRFATPNGFQSRRGRAAVANPPAVFPELAE